MEQSVTGTMISSREQRSRELQDSLDKMLAHLSDEGYTVSFGSIGLRTTWALLTKGSVEIVGYTYIRGDLSLKSELIGKYRSLTQALSRKSLINPSEELLL